MAVLLQAHDIFHCFFLFAKTFYEEVCTFKSFTSGSNVPHIPMMTCVLVLNDDGRYMQRITKRYVTFVALFVLLTWTLLIINMCVKFYPSVSSITATSHLGSPENKKEWVSLRFCKHHFGFFTACQLNLVGFTTKTKQRRWFCRTKAMRDSNPRSLTLPSLWEYCELLRQRVPGKVGVNYINET